MSVHSVKFGELIHLFHFICTFGRLDKKHARRFNGKLSKLIVRE